jgi:hypothetical protein
MRRLKKLVKKFEFIEENRSRITLGSTSVRLSPESAALQLRAINDTYPTTADLFAKTWLTNPRSVKRWIGFESVHVNGENSLGVEQTAVLFRLNDGTDDRFWDGAAWSVASSSDWNTEEEVATNISTFPVTSQSLQVVINLSTSDSAYTPYVYAIKVLYESDAEMSEDLLARGLLAALKTNIRPIARLQVDSDETDEIVLAPETPYDIVSVDAVYNVTADPNRLVDLYDSYDSSTQTVTLTAAQDAGDQLLVQFCYRPVAAIMTSQDFTELARVPAITIEDFRETRSFDVSGAESVVNKATGSGWRLQGGRQTTYEVPLRMIASKEFDVQRLGDELRRFFRSTSVLTIPGVDEQVRIQVIDETDAQNYANLGGMHFGRMRFRIVNAVSYLDDAEQVYGIRRIVFTGGNLELVIDPNEPAALSTEALVASSDWTGVAAVIQAISDAEAVPASSDWSAVAATAEAEQLDDLTGIVINLNATNITQVASRVSAWDTLVEATGANQPLYTASDSLLNNQASVTFDNLNTRLRAPGVVSIQHWFIVGYYPGTLFADYSCLLSFSGAVSGQVPMHGDSGTASWRAAEQPTGTTTYRNGVATGVALSVANAPTIWEVQFSTPQIAAWNLSYESPSGRHWRGAICLARGYSALKTGTDRDNILATLAAYAGITL